MIFVHLWRWYSADCCNEPPCLWNGTLLPIQRAQTTNTAPFRMFSIWNTRKQTNKSTQSTQRTSNPTLRLDWSIIIDMTRTDRGMPARTTRAVAPSRTTTPRPHLHAPGTRADDTQPLRTDDTLVRGEHVLDVNVRVGCSQWRRQCSLPNNAHHTPHTRAPSERRAANFHAHLRTAHPLY